MEIIILGPGCNKCKYLERVASKLVKEMKIEANVKFIDDIAETLKYNVMMTPAILINGEVVLVGKVPSQGEMKKMIKDRI